MQTEGLSALTDPKTGTVEVLKLNDTCLNAELFNEVHTLDFGGQQQSSLYR